MRHRQSGRHLGRDTAHRKALYRNLVTDLLRYERITTTQAKAKEIRPMAERIITLGKRGDLHARRQALRFIYDGHVVEHVFEEIAPRMADRAGGYLRITALEPRKGDGARMATIELVDYNDVGTGVTAAPAARTATPAPAAAPVTQPGSGTAPAEELEPEAETDVEATAEAPEAVEETLDEEAGEGSDEETPEDEETVAAVEERPGAEEDADGGDEEAVEDEEETKDADS